MTDPLFKNDSLEAKLAQKLVDKKFRDDFAKVPDGWDFAIDLDTHQTYSAASPLQIRKKAASKKRIVTLAHKAKGRDNWPWRIVRLDPKALRVLEEFQTGKRGAFAYAAKSSIDFKPVIFRKVDDLTRAVILADSIESLKKLQPHPDAGSEVRQVTFMEVESFTRKSGGQWVIEMIT